jgi:hypothetical protein
MSEDYQELLQSVFCNDKGRKLLKVWKQNFMERPSFHYENTPEQTAYRDAERMFVQNIFTITGEE